MDPQQVKKLIELGETPTVEFKRCGGNPSADVFETICSFANGFGGTLLLGVTDNGAIEGVGERALEIRRNIANVINNPATFDTPISIESDEVLIDGKSLVRLWVPPSPSIHSFKKVIYARVEDSDVALRTADQISQLAIRKQGIYTEQRVFRHVAVSDLRQDLIEGARKLAVANRPGHPWRAMTDEELLRSAGLMGHNYASGEDGINLAGILLLGKDEVIRSVCPQYRTDAIVQRGDENRYDDRITERTNLMDSYRGISRFCEASMPDRFYLEGDRRVSLRDVIVRELVVNCLIHREFTSPYGAIVTIDPAGIATQNASRASFQGRLDPSGFNPNPKNPIIAGFFREMGLAEELGSGTRNLYRCSRLYSGGEPVLEEGVVFKAFVPISASSGGDDFSANERAVLRLLARLGEVSVSDVESEGVSRRTAQRTLAGLVDKGVLLAEGGGRSRRYRIAKES